MLFSCRTAWMLIARRRLIRALGASNGLERRIITESDLAYTLAMYRVKPGQEDAFVAAWNELAEMFSSLSNPPLWGTLIRHRTERTLYMHPTPLHLESHVSCVRARVMPGVGPLRSVMIDVAKNGEDA